jgi:hypothetical protein
MCEPCRVRARLRQRRRRDNITPLTGGDGEAERCVSSDDEEPGEGHTLEGREGKRSVREAYLRKQSRVVSSCGEVEKGSNSNVS